MSITFSYADGPKTIDEFVRHRAPRPYYYLLYARLGDLYIEKERYTDAADSYRAFVSQDRNNEKAPLLEMQAIEAYSKGGFPQLVLQGKKEFVENYSYGTAYWQGRTPQGEPKVVAVLKTNLKDVAQYYHAQAQRTKNIGRLSGGGEMVSQLFDLVPGRPGFGGNQLPAGRYLVREQAYLDAAQEYENTAYGYGGHEKAAAAGYAAIVAYGKEEEGLSGEAKAKVHSREIDSSLKFAQTFPLHPESAQVLTRAAARAVCGEGLCARNVSGADAARARNPRSMPAKQRIAWTVIANSNFEQGHFDKAEAGYVNAQALMPRQRSRTPGDRRAARRLDLQAGRSRRTRPATAPRAVEDFLRVVAAGAQLEGARQCGFRRRRRC